MIMTTEKINNDTDIRIYMATQSRGRRFMPTYITLCTLLLGIISYSWLLGQFDLNHRGQYKYDDS